MAIRIVGVDLPQNKRGEVALTYVYGIGRSSSAKILDKAGVDRDLKVKDWTDDQAAKIREIIGAEYKVEGDLRSEVQLNIKRLMDIGCYRGVRHRIGLPVRGQSTKNNARTRKGRKKTVANKKKACLLYTSGRPKGYIRQFGISRIQFREMASNGLIPGCLLYTSRCV